MFSFVLIHLAQNHHTALLFKNKTIQNLQVKN